MVRSLETIDLTEGFQPAIDLRDRATDDENGIVPLLALAAAIVVASYICKAWLHGKVTFGFPYGWTCKF